MKEVTKENDIILQYEDWEQWDTNKGNGGGGSKKKKRGKKTIDEIAKVTAAQGRVNRETNKSLIRNEENPQIDVVLKRIAEASSEIDLDKNYKYIDWVVRSILSFGEDTSTHDDIRVSFYRKAHGAGGQNVNKLATAVVIDHKYGLWRVDVCQQRTQSRNRQIATQKMMEIVEAHIENWLETIMNATNGWTVEDVRTAVKEVLKNYKKI